MKIEIYGSSSEGNAYSISDGDTRLLLECGIPINDLKIKTNFFDPMPAACLISHSHGDHAKSVKDLQRLGIQCGMSGATYSELFEEPITENPFVKTMYCDIPFSIGTFRIKPLAMSHDVYCLGFYIYSTVTKESLFFATDTCYIPYSLPPMDYIMIEANYDLDVLNNRIMNGDVDPAMKSRLARSHMEINNTLSWLKKQDLSKVKRIYLLHLSYGSANSEEFKRKLEEATGVPVTIAE